MKNFDKLFNYNITILCLIVCHLTYEDQQITIIIYAIDIVIGCDTLISFIEVVLLILHLNLFKNKGISWIVFVKLR